MGSAWYRDRRSWAEYFRRDVLPLYESAVAVVSLWSELKRRVGGRLLSDVLRTTPSLEPAFVGGTRPPNKYDPKGLAYAYKELFGVSVNLREYYFLKAHGREPRVACKVEEKTLFVTYVELVAELLRRALVRASGLGLIGEDEVWDAEKVARESALNVITRPESVSELLAGFVNRALRFVATYNEHTRLVWHMRKIPRRYIKELYPELLEPETFRFIRDLLGLREYIVPEVDDEEIADMYTIYSYDYAVTAVEREGNTWIDGLDWGMILSGDMYGRVTPSNMPYATVGGCLVMANVLLWQMLRGEYWSRLWNLVVDELVDPERDVLLWQMLRGEEYWSWLWNLVVDELVDPELEWRSMVREVAGELGSCPRNLRYPRSYEDLILLAEVLPATFYGFCEFVVINYPQEATTIRVFSRW